MDNKPALTEQEQEAVALHSAGATVRHQNPFSQLPTLLNDALMSQEMCRQWVIPFYMKQLAELRADFTKSCAEATPELTLYLLGERNWRPRTVGARFAAIRQFDELQEEISHLLLKSEVCFVGRDYCLALAVFGNRAAADTLCLYLDYYLRQSDLWFDQGQAMAALIYLDELHSSNQAEPFMKLWQQFVSDKPRWELSDFQSGLDKSLATVQNIRHKIAANL